MKKIITTLAVSLYISKLILTVSAQTVDPSNVQSSSLIGQIIAIIGVIAVFSVIAYAGYKLVKKWSSQSD